jgi:hypothetical protein
MCVSSDVSPRIAGRRAKAIELRANPLPEIQARKQLRSTREDLEKPNQGLLI